MDLDTRLVLTGDILSLQVRVYLPKQFWRRYTTMYPSSGLGFSVGVSITPHPRPRVPWSPKVPALSPAEDLKFQIISA